MAEVFDFAKGKAAYETKKAQQQNTEADAHVLSSEDIADLFALTEEEAARLLEENLTAVFNKIMERSKTVENFTEEEAKEILNKHFEDLFAQVIMASLQEDISQEDAMQKLDQLLSRRAPLSLRLIKNNPDSEK